MNYKNEKFRIISLLAAAVTFTALAASCSSESTSSSSVSEESTAATSAAEEKTAEPSAEALSAISEKITKNAVSDLFSARDLTQTYDTPTAVITLEGDSASVKGSGASAKGSVITITEEGIYLITGTLDDGQIIVNADKAKVQLVLDNADVTCKDGPAICGLDSDKIFITLAEDSKNTLTDGETYADTSEEAPDACIWSKDSLTFNGLGELTINGNNSCGVHSSDDIIVTGSTIRITSADHGIKAKDYFAAAGGELDITSGSDGIKTTNTEEEGFVYIENGSFTINSKQDGIQAETDLTIIGGEFDITSGGGSASSTKSHSEDFGGGIPDFGGDRPGFGEGMPDFDGEMSDFDGDMPDFGNFDPFQGERPDLPEGMEPPEGLSENADTSIAQSLERSAEELPESEQTAVTDEDSDSAKGLKAGGALCISGGTFKIDSADDALHSGGDMSISGGKIEAQAGDDGIHSDSAVDISENAGVNINKSYEGIEASAITIRGGDVNVTASDDGLNASNGTTSQGGMGTYSQGVLVEISGGNVYVNADGDGLDSNGDLIISGGTVLVNGPTNSGNGALDSNGEIKITGGTVAAAGMSGMAETPGSDSTQYSVSCTFESTYDGGTEVTLKDADGNEIITFTPSKSFNNIVFSSPEIQSGGSYTVSAGSEENSFTAQDMTTIIGQQSSMGFGGGRPGGRGDRGGFGSDTEEPQI